MNEINFIVIMMILVIVNLCLLVVGVFLSVKLTTIILDKKITTKEL